MKHAAPLISAIVFSAAITVSLIGSVSAQGTGDAESCELPRGNLSSRPHVAGEPTKISIGLLLIDVTQIDDVRQQLFADFAVFQAWTDPRLKGLSGCRFDLSRVWSPEITFMNSGRVFPALSARVEVGEDGHVRYSQRYRGSLSFRHALHEFPFDSHTVRIGLIPVRADRHSYELTVNEDRISRLEQFTGLDVRRR